MYQSFRSLALVFFTSLILLGSGALQAAPPADAPMAEAAVVETVNVNTATAEELSAALKGVGPKHAEAIVAYRSSSGPFKSKEDLLNVKGFGKKTLEKNWDSIVLK